MAVRAVTSLAELQQLAARARPQQVLAGDRMLAVREDLAPLLPLGGLRRGTVTGVDSRALLHALLAEPSRAGSWVGLVGLGSLGLAAALEAGIVAERTVVVDAAARAPGPGVLADAIAALIDALDIVVLGPRLALTAAPARRLEARARERGAVVMVEGRRTWPGATDLDLRVVGRHPVGLAAGHGHLHGVRAVVEVTGRGAAARPRRGEVWLQGAATGPFPAGQGQDAAGQDAAGQDPAGQDPAGTGRLRAVG